MRMGAKGVWHACGRVCLIYIQWIGWTHGGYWFIWMRLSVCVVINLCWGLSPLWWKLHHWQPGRKATSLHQMHKCVKDRGHVVYTRLRNIHLRTGFGTHGLDLKGHLHKPCYALLKRCSWSSSTCGKLHFSHEDENAGLLVAAHPFSSHNTLGFFRSVNHCSIL